MLSPLLESKIDDAWYQAVALICHLNDRPILRGGPTIPAGDPVANLEECVSQLSHLTGRSKARIKRDLVETVKRGEGLMKTMAS